jgi:hypothetical protein
MKTKLKPWFILSITLIIGILIGFLAKSWIIKHSFEKFNRLRNEKGLLNAIEENVKISDEQKLILEPILMDFQKKMSKRAEESRAEFHNLIDSLKKEMKAVLNEQQYEELLKNRLFNPPDRFRKKRLPFGEQPDSLKGGPPPFHKEPGPFGEN